LKIDGTKLTVKENTILSLTCEISETNPPSTVTLTVGGEEIASKGMTTKPFNDDNERKFVYSYSVEVKRDLKNKNLICESKMNGIDEEMAKKWQIKAGLSKKFTLDVQCKSVCWLIYTKS
jgi:hypothetical protein